MMNPEIWERVLWPKVAIIFDCDGVLVPQRQVKVSSDLRDLIKGTQTLNVVATGRPLGSAWEVGSQISAKGAFGENGLRYQMMETDVVCPITNNDIPRFKKVIRFEYQHSPFAKITLGGERSQVLVEIGKHQILTLGTVSMREQGLEHKLPSCRWSSGELRELTLELIKRKSLRVAVLGPYEDHNLDFQPTDENGVPYDKRLIPGIIRERFPWVETIIACVDGPNDIGLATEADISFTFENGCDEVKRAVKENGGIVFPGVGNETGCIAAMQFVRQEFLGLEAFDLELARQRRNWRFDNTVRSS